MESALDSHYSIPTKLICREHTKKQDVEVFYTRTFGHKYILKSDVALLTVIG
jgi:hypothetical protein